MNKIEIGIFNCELFDRCSMIAVLKRSYWRSICTIITPRRILYNYAINFWKSYDSENIFVTINGKYKNYTLGNFKELQIELKRAARKREAQKYENIDSRFPNILTAEFDAVTMRLSLSLKSMKYF